MTSSILSVLLVPLVFCISVVDPTGIKIRITNQALNTLRNLAQAIAQERLVNQPFDIFQSSVCSLDRLTITQLTIHQSELRFRQNLGFQFNIQNFDARVSFNHRIVSKTGTKDITAQGVSVNMELSLIRTQQGRLAITMPTCAASAERMRLTNSNNPGTLENIVMGCLRHLFNFRFCPSLVQRYGIPYVNQMLETIPMRYLIPGFGISIDYSLTRDVQVTANNLDTSFNGLVFREGENIHALNPAVEPVFTENNRMAYVGVSDAVFNSAAVAFYNAGVLNRKFETPIPSDEAITALRALQLSSQPLRMKAPLVASFQLTEAPRITISQTQGVTVNLRVEANAVSVPENKEPKVITSASATCEVRLMVTIQGSAEGNRLRLSNQNVMCRIATSDWRVKFFVGRLENTVKEEGSKFLEGRFKDGIKVPLPHGLIFIDPLLQYQNDFVVVGGNLNLAPAGRQWVMDRIGR